MKSYNRDISYLLLVAIVLICLNNCSSGDSPGDRGDKSAPTIVMTSPLPQGEISQSITLTWTVSDENPARVQVLLSDNGGATYTTTLFDDRYSDSEMSYVFDSTQFNNGSNYKLKILAKDIPNNQSSVESSIFSINNGITPIEQFSLSLVPTTIPSNLNVRSVLNIQWTGSGLSGATLDIEYSLDNINYPASQQIVKNLLLTNSSGGSYAWNTVGLNFPQVNLRLTARKLNGTTKEVTSAFFIIDNTPPTLPSDTNLTFSYSNSSLKVSCNAAIDNIQLVPNYYLINSDTNNISTLNEIHTNNPTSVKLTTPCDNSIPINLGGDPQNLHRYWNIVVSDNAGNEQIYTASKIRGSLYTSFGQTGELIITDNAANTSPTIADAIIGDAFDNIIVVGRVGANLALWKFDHFGDPVLSFGTSGKIEYPNPYDAADTPIARAIQIDERASYGPNNYRILVCGRWKGPSGSNEMMFRAFNADGSPDSSFNNTGYNSITRGLNSSCNGLFVDADSGNIYSTGEGQINFTSSIDILLAKLTQAGVRDSGFSGGGLISIDGPIASVNTIDRGFGVTLDANADVILTGMTESAAASYMVLAKFNSSGNPVSFASTGKNTIASVLPKSFGKSILIDSGNNIIVSGLAAPNSQNFPNYVAFGVWHYQEDGTPMSAANLVSGFLKVEIEFEIIDPYFPLDDISQSFMAISKDANDNLIFAGNMGNSSFYNSKIWRINAINNTKDSAFLFNQLYTPSVNNISRAVYINPISGITYSAGYVENNPINLQILAIQ